MFREYVVMIRFITFFNDILVLVCLFLYLTFSPYQRIWHHNLDAGEMSLFFITEPNVLPVFPLHKCAIPEYFQSGIFTNMIRGCYGIYKYKFVCLNQIQCCLFTYLSEKFCNYKEITSQCISAILTFSITVYFTKNYFALLLEIT